MRSSATANAPAAIFSRASTMAALMCLIAALTPSVSRSQASRVDVAAADKDIRSLADSGFAGVVLIARGDSVLLHRSYGSAAHRPDTTTAFWIASMTKAFTAAAILKLQEERRLSVHDTLGKFFPDAPVDKRRITIHQLLTHTAGLAGTDAARGITQRSFAVKAILNEPLTYQPGKGYRYINDDYQLLAAIVEKVSRMSWADFVRAELLKPAGMRHTGFGFHDWGHRGSDGMSSNARDLFTWTRTLRGGTVLTRASETALQAPQVFVRHEPDADVYYGYGVRVYRSAGRTTEIMHSGSGDEGHTGIIRLIAPDLTIIVLSNAGLHAGTTWSSYIAHRIASPRKRF